jgi:hypothetical protein
MPTTRMPRSHQATQGPPYEAAETYRDGDSLWPPRHYLGKSYDGLDDVHEMPPPPIVPKAQRASTAPVYVAIAVVIVSILSAMGLVDFVTQVTK